MGLTFWASLMIAVASSVMAAIIIIFFKRAFARWNRIDNKHELYWLKVDCMIDALKKVNSGIGDKFAEEYDKAFEFRTQDRNFINNN